MAESFPFDRGARYGSALVGTLFAGYLCIATSFDAFIEATNYAGAIGTDVPLVDLVEFLLILGLFIAAFTVMLASGARRLGAVTLACVVLLLWATLGIQRGIGNIRHPIEFWAFVTDQGLVTLIVALGGWLLVRGRHPLSFVVLLLALVPPVVTGLLVGASVTSGAFTLVSLGVVIMLGIGGAWLAVVIDRAIGRARPPAQPTPASRT
ncbi:hypothetical protein [Microbacterium sp.]|uniref:hypothetical protein n=1 Tax=Microbacterium sp. TaxID=51671 RepID=UPI0037C5871D